MIGRRHRGRVPTVPSLGPVDGTDVDFAVIGYSGPYQAALYRSRTTFERVRSRAWDELRKLAQAADALTAPMAEREQPPPPPPPRAQPPFP